MKKITVFAVLMVMAFFSMTGMYLTMHAGEVDATVAGDSNFRNRYPGLVSTTPITDINSLNSVSSNVQTQIDAVSDGAVTNALADTKVFVGSAGGEATAQNISIINDITASLTNAGVLNATIAAGVINSGKLDTYTIALTVSNTASTGTASGDASDLYTGALLTTIGGINGTNLVNDISHDGFGNFTVAMVNAVVGGDAVWTLGFINSN